MKRMKSTNSLILRAKIFIVDNKIIKQQGKKKKILMNRNLKVNIITIQVLKSILNLFLRCRILQILLIKDKKYKIAIN